jgi:S-disulfanyl-L-cysteine oxidoreductase SoxD
MIWLLLAACGDPAPPHGSAGLPAGESPGTAPLPLPERFGLGRPPTDAEVAAWDIDVNPSWVGLPAGRGTVAEGRILYLAQCAACHGVDGKAGAGYLGPLLIGPEPRDGLAEDWRIPHTIGNWWPYASTVFDYVRRAMPQTAPGSLTADQTYALVAFLLAENQAVSGDFVADQDSIRTVKMPTKLKFVADDREAANTFR